MPLTTRRPADAAPKPSSRATSRPYAPERREPTIVTVRSGSDVGEEVASAEAVEDLGLALVHGRELGQAIPASPPPHAGFASRCAVPARSFGVPPAKGERAVDVLGRDLVAPGEVGERARDPANAVVPAARRGRAFGAPR